MFHSMSTTTPPQSPTHRRTAPRSKERCRLQGKTAPSRLAPRHPCQDTRARHNHHESHTQTMQPPTPSACTKPPKHTLGVVDDDGALTTKGSRPCDKELFNLQTARIYESLRDFDLLMIKDVLPGPQGSSGPGAPPLVVCHIRSIGCDKPDKGGSRRGRSALECGVCMRNVHNIAI